MPDWDADSPRLRRNLRYLWAQVEVDAQHRAVPGIATARRWHRDMLDGLDVPDERFRGMFRGEAGLEDVQVGVGKNLGVDAEHVPRELDQFQRQLRLKVARLDRLIPPGAELTPATLAEVIDLCAWAH